VKADWRFLRIIAYVYLGSFAPGYLLFTIFASPEATRGGIAAMVMSLINILLGYIAIETSFEKGSITFLKIVLGGMGARLFLMSGAVFVLIRYFAFQPLSLTLTLLFYYALNLGLEIYLLEHRVNVRKQS
jgi:hypothetical protein